MNTLRTALENMVSQAAEDLCFLLDYGFSRSWTLLSVMALVFAIVAADLFIAALFLSPLLF